MEKFNFLLCSWKCTERKHKDRKEKQVKIINPDWATWSRIKYWKMLVHIQFRQENSEKITNLWTLRTIMEFLKCDKTRYYKRHHQSKLHERRIL